MDIEHNIPNINKLVDKQYKQMSYMELRNYVKNGLRTMYGKDEKLFQMAYVDFNVGEED